MSYTGTTMICQYCGRPIIGEAAFGNGGEPYHPACTQPPTSKGENNEQNTNFYS